MNAPATCRSVVLNSDVRTSTAGTPANAPLVTGWWASSDVKISTSARTAM